MFNVFCQCTVCKKNPDVKYYTYYSEDKEKARITKACCEDCHKKTHEEWMENGWKHQLNLDIRRLC